ncbi:MAG: methyltransferase domain-containing protein [Methyloceanibacter sp.]
MTKITRTAKLRASAKGAVGDGIVAPNSQWSFGGRVAETFGEHVRRSVPLYDEAHDLICRISDYFVQKNSTVYDLGASTGQLTAKLAERHEAKPGVTLVGIDREDSMIKQARKAVGDRANVRFEVGDINNWDYEPCDLIISFYTIQFVPPRIRQDLINKIYRSLNWAGAFLFFEKVRAPDARFQDICTGIYTDFKLENGFSEAEIINKSRSLKGTLEPFSTNGNLDLLRRAGFVDIMTVMKYVPFEGFLAIK